MFVANFDIKKCVYIKYMSKEIVVTEEFTKVIQDFVQDIKTTFPEYQPFIAKWWKDVDSFQGTPEEVDALLKESRGNSIHYVFKFCMKKYPPRFFDILYQNNDIFKEDSELDTEFLPYVHFKNLWACDISEATRTTIWKYLQLILISIVGSVDNREAFGDSAKLFDSINEDEFKGKLEETLEQMKGIFENKNSSSDDGEGSGLGAGPDANYAGPNAQDIHNHLNEMMGGKLGQLAKEIAEETVEDMDFDVGDATDAQGIFKNLFKNPGKLMGLVKNVGDKLDTKIKSGDIKQSELMQEASEMLQKMKGMPGMGDLQSMFGKMGMNLGGQKLNVPAMEAKLNQNIKTEKMKERIRENSDAKRLAKAQADAAEAIAALQRASGPKISDEELFEAFEKETDKDNKSKKSGGGKKKKGGK
jgi:hypothetical protein